MAKTDIFVFGSNDAGIHGAGAAAFAYKNKGARWGHSYGMSGQSFAIPTKDEDIQSLPLDRIKGYVEGFISFAKGHPKLTFQVTQIGCGLAGFTASDIAPMFMDAPKNCQFDNAWFPYLTTGAGDKPQHRYWGTM